MFIKSYDTLESIKKIVVESTLKNIKEKLVLTGASGLLGNRLVELARENRKVTPLHNSMLLQLNSLRLNVTNQSQVLNLFAELKPEIVIHTASETNVDRCETQKEHVWKINVEGTNNIVKACKKLGAILHGGHSTRLSP